MNHVYRVIWNRSLNVFQAASELARASGSGSCDRVSSGSQPDRPALKAIVVAMAALGAVFGPATAFATAYEVSLNGTGVYVGTPSAGTADWTWDGESATFVSGATLVATEYAAIVESGVTIDSMTNNATITGAGGLDNFGTIGEIDNNGVIATNYGTYGLTNYGTVTTFNNSGRLGVNAAGTVTSTSGINNESTGGAADSVIGTLHNTSTGIIGGVYYGIFNAGAGPEPDASGTTIITTVINDGLIEGVIKGISNYGTIGAINNTSTGIISGPTAIYNGSGATLGTVTNAGIIRGDIENDASQDLTFAGGTTGFGTLTGADFVSQGEITNTGGNVVFASGNTLLNDNINAGSFSVNNTGATLQVNNPVTITGGYNQTAGTLVIGVGDGATHTGNESDTGYGRLIVSGDVTLAAGTGVELKSTTGNYAFAAGQRFVVIESTGINVNYNESALNYSIAGYTSSITGSSMTVDNGELVDTDLVLQINSATATGSSSPTGTPNATVPNAIQSLGGLSRYAGVSNAGLLNLFDAADALEATGTTAQLNKAGAQLSPIQQANSSQAAAAPTIDVLNVVADHVQSLRLAQADGNDSGESSGISTGESLAGWGVWGQAFGGHASQGQRGDTPGYNANYGGLLLGADKAIDDHWRVGGVFNYSNTQINDTDDAEGDSTEVNAYGLLGYASYTGQPWYVNVSGGV
ncbi:autotransporter domain-containing protein, partial [Pararobbsia silviterrae]